MRSLVQRRPGRLDGSRRRAARVQRALAPVRQLMRASLATSWPRRARASREPRGRYLSLLSLAALCVMGLLMLFRFLPIRDAMGATDGALPAHVRTLPQDSAHVPTRVSMRRVDFYVDSEVVLHIRHLDGTMRSKKGGPVIFDDKNSFIIAIADAEVGMTGADLTALLNKYVFGYKGSPLTNLHLRTEGDHIVQTGRMHKGVTLPFELTATMDVAPNGLIRIHPTQTKIMGVNGDKLMKFLGLSLEKLIDLKGANGATVHGNDLFLDPVKILPPPTIEGRISAVRVDGDEVVQVFGTPEEHAKLHPLVPPDTKAPNYMFYKGGTLRFGRLLMLDASMQIVDLDPGAEFKFDLGRYNAQLVAGYERTLADGGLEVWMRDVDKLGEPVHDHAKPALPDAK